MLHFVSASCLLMFLAAALADGDLLSHKNWHLLDQEGECGHSPNLESSSEQDTDNEIPFRIFKGTDADEHEFPWMAQLILKAYQNGSFPICGGTLINKRYVMTAAHCVAGARSKMTTPVNSMYVKLGAHRVENNCNIDECKDIQQVGVEEIIAHEHYTTRPVYEYNDHNSKNDIALIRLKDDVRFVSGVISPVCLPADSEMIRLSFYGQKMVAAGFGQNNSVPKGTLPDVLQKMSTSVLSPYDCDMPIGWYGPRIQICVGGISNQGICRGDSGGPLMYRDELKKVYYQMGIASYIFHDCDKNVHPFKQDVIYTRVAHFMPWILDHLRE